jgi:uncharacterized protein (DUF983 family)
MEKPSTLEVLKRGWRRRCPRCGVGKLFIRGIRPYERCSECGLLLHTDQGNTWMFMIITDRIPILAGIVILYFGFVASNWMTAAAFFIVLTAPLIATIRQRQGLAIALDYLSRLYMPD